MTSVPFTLSCHAQTPALAVTAMRGRITLDGAWIRLRWRMEGASLLAVPAFAGKGRADNLWQTTCFELFIVHDLGPAYTELNLSPSERWAAYDFAARRSGMANRPMPHEPVCTMRKGETLAIFDAAIPAAGLPLLPWRCGVSAVIEETGNHKSYWALSHGAVQPDFHDPSCFTLQVPAPEAA